MSVCGGGAWEVALAQQLHQHIVTNHIEKQVTSQTRLMLIIIIIPIALIFSITGNQFYGLQSQPCRG